MTPIEIADATDLGLSLTAGVLLTLLGFRVLGSTRNLDVFHAKWGKHFRWIGLGYIVLVLVQHFLFT